MVEWFEEKDTEFRGPGVHHSFDDGDSGYDNADLEQRSRSFGANYGGRIIFLGDGTEVHPNSSDDSDMVDQTEEDKDLESQVTKGDKKEEAATDSKEQTGSEKTDAEKPKADNAKED
ncbi:hypothetical protein jhhlp_006142 [Lomentospora prolificans]|uniref:Uncharacterized protein n=1 Tax=Lomentospora prolificans TaxID=41688 RepID=A0A2N3N527_9PEZI|nr:hypothetical protein jhhlp_006142 [Lomentospora prolificans]